MKAPMRRRREALPTAVLFLLAAAVVWALPAGPTLSAIKMGALVSVAGGALALAAAASLRCGRFRT
jgi:hypothetical protein